MNGLQVRVRRRFAFDDVEIVERCARSQPHFAAPDNHGPDSLWRAEAGVQARLVEVLRQLVSGG